MNYQRYYFNKRSNYFILTVPGVLLLLVRDDDDAAAPHPHHVHQLPRHRRGHLQVNLDYYLDIFISILILWGCGVVRYLDC